MDASRLGQGTDEWKMARCGSLGASRVSEAVAKTKSGWSSSRDNLMADLIIERLTGFPIESFVTKAMLEGIENEPAARAAYEFKYDVDAVQVGLITHPKIHGTHASPDGLIGEDGLIEIKSPQPAAHLEVLLSGNVPDKYIKQMYWQMSCTGRAWCDFVSYSPKFPPPMQLFVKRFERNDKRIEELETCVREFLTELECKVLALRTQYDLKNTLEAAE